MKTTNEKPDSRIKTKNRKGGYKSTKGNGNSPAKGQIDGRKSEEKKTNRGAGQPNTQDTTEERKATPSSSNKRETPNRWETFDTKLKEKQKTSEKMQNIVMQMIPPQKAEPVFDFRSMQPAGEFKLPPLKPSSGGDIRRGSESSIGKRSSNPLMLHDNPQTLSIFNDIAMKRKSRLEKEIREKLNEIHGRVQHTLQNSGFEDDELNIEKRTAATELLTKGIAARSRREKVDERKHMVSVIHEYVGDCKERYELIDQVNNWIHMQQEELEKELKPDQEYSSAIKSADALYRDVTDNMYVYTDTTEKLITISQILLRNVHQLIPKKEKHHAPKIVVLDDHSMLASTVKWDTAVSAITNLLEEGVKWVKDIPLKLALKNGKKQYVYLLKAIDKRLADLASSQKTIEDLKNKVSLGNTRIDECLKEQSDLMRSLMNLETNLEDVKNQLKMAHEKNEKLLAKIGKLEVVVSDLKEELAKCPLTPLPPPEPEIVYLAPPTPPKPPSPPPKPTISDEVKEQIRLMEKQIKDYQTVVTELQGRIMMLENNVVKEQDKVKMLKTALEEAKKQLQIAHMNSDQSSGQPDAPAPTPEFKMELKLDIPDIIGQHSQDIQNFKLSEASANYYKTLLSGMKQDFAHEMERLKEHVKKENTRHDATVRKMEHTHKDQIKLVKKSVLRLLRSLKYFRDQLAMALAKEGYAESASQLDALPNIMPDDLKIGAKELLSKLSSNVVEYLHKIEIILVNTLKTIRIMNKSIATSQKEGMVKEIADRVKNITNAKELSKQTAVRLKTNKAKLENKEEDFIANHNNDKYSSLLKRYKLIWKMYMKMMSEMDVLECDFERILEENVGDVDPLLISQIRMEIKKAKLDKKENDLKGKENVSKEGIVGKKGKPLREVNVTRDGKVDEVNISRGGKVDVSRHGKIDISRDGKVYRSRDGKVDISKDGELDMSRDGSVNISRDGKVNISRDGESEISRYEYSDITRDRIVNISRDGKVDLSGYGKVDLSQEQKVGISRDGKVDISRDGKVHISRDGKVDLSRDEKVDISRDGKVHISRDGKEHISRDGKVDISRDGKVYMSRDGKVDISSDGKVYMSRDGKVDMSRDEKLDMSRDGKVYMSRDGKVDMSRDEKVDISRERKVYMSRDGKVDISRDGKVDISRDEKVDISRDGKEYMSRDEKVDISRDGKVYMSRDGKVDISRDGKVDISRDGKVFMSRDGKVDMSRDEKVDISRDGKVYMSRDGKVDISRDGKVDISRDEKVDISRDGKVYMSRDEKVDISRDGKVYMSRDGKVDISRDGKVDISRDEKLDTSRDGKVYMSRDGKVYMSRDGKEDISRDGKVYMSRDGKVDISRDGKVDISRDEKVDISRDGKVYMSRDGKVYMSRDEKVDISRDGKVDISRDGKVYISRDGKVDISRDGKVDISRDENVDISRDENVDISRDRSVNISRGGKVNISGDGKVRKIGSTAEGGNTSTIRADDGKLFKTEMDGREGKITEEGIATEKVNIGKEGRAISEVEAGKQDQELSDGRLMLSSRDKPAKSFDDGDEFEDGDDFLDYNFEDGEHIYGDDDDREDDDDDDDEEDEDDFSEGLDFNIPKTATKKEMHKPVHKNVAQPKTEFTPEEKQTIPESKTNRKPEGHTQVKFTMKGKDVERNIHVLENAHKKKLIISDLYRKAKDSILSRKKSIVQLFQNLVNQYVAFKALQEAEEKSKKLVGGDVYLPTSKRPALQNLLKRINKRLTGDYIKAKRESENTEETICKSGRIMMNMCNEVLMATGVELVKPNAIIVEKPSTTPHLPPLTHPASRKLQTLFARRQKQERIRKYRCSLPPLLVGNTCNINVTKMTNRPSWRNEGLQTHVPKAIVTTPLFVSLDVNNSILKAKRSLLRKKSKECKVSKTRSYHLTSDLRLKFINEII